MGPLVHKYTGVALPTVVPSGVVEQEQPVRSGPYSTSGAPGGMSQSITFGSNPGEVTGVRVEMSNNFFPTPSSFYFGLVRFAFYEDLSDSPTGPPLVTSPFYNASYLNSGPVTSFYPVFSGWTPTAFTKYVLVAEFYDNFDYPIQGIGFGINNAGGYADGVFKSRNDPFGPIYTSQIDIGTGFTSVGSNDLTFAVYATEPAPPVTEDPITSIDSSSLAVVTISNLLSTDETNALKIDVSQLEPEPGTGRPVREVYIERIKAITSGVDVDILWDATSPEHCLSISGDSGIDWDFRAVGPLTNNAGAGKTGNILFSTNGATTGSSYSVTLVMRKKY